MQEFDLIQQEGIDVNGVMSKAQFDMQAQANKLLSAGSGFVEWGKNRSAATNVNQGLQCYEGSLHWISSLALGVDIGDIGVSKTTYPVVNLDGVLLNLNSIRAKGSNIIDLPPAPNGTKTYDSATDVVVQHSTVDDAFASETTTNKVIITRKDLCFLESWHELISDKDVVYPFGNVQFGAAAWEGISLINNVVAQGYSAFGEWDTTSKGYGVKWSTLTLEQKLKFVKESVNNIYFDGKDFIQVRYRIRVVEGRDDNFNTPITSGKANFIWHYGTKRNGDGMGITPQCKMLNDNGNRKIAWIQEYGTGIAFCGGYTSKPDSNLAYLGKAFAIPICLVQRLNSGAGDKTYNPFGCGQFEEGKLWYNSTFKPTSTKDCFTHTVNGTIASGKSGSSNQFKYADAIYAGQVEDLRLSAHVQDTNQLLEDSIRKAVAGEMRGKGKVPFTKVFADKATADNEGYVEGANSGSHYVALKWLTPEFNSLPWVDIVGSPENIATMFPNGVVGQWLPVVPDGTVAYFPLNRKSNVSSITTIGTTDLVNWAQVSYTGNSFNVAQNAITYATKSKVALFIYESLSNFTEASDNSKVVGQVGDVWAGMEQTVSRGNRLIPSLIGKIGKHVGEGRKFGDYNLLGKTVENGVLQSVSIYAPTHSSLEFSNPSNNSPAVKALYTLTSKDGLLYMQLHGSELKYKADAADGTDKWGDTTPATPLSSPYGVIPIIDGEGTKTDLNGNIVKTFCHHTMIPLGISNATSSEAVSVQSIDNSMWVRPTSFHSLADIPAPIKGCYREDQVVLSYNISYVTETDPVTGDPYQKEVKTPVYGTKLVRLPAYWENGGHIDSYEIAKWDFWKEYIEYLHKVDEVNQYNNTPQYDDEGNEIVFDKLSLPTEPVKS